MPELDTADTPITGRRTLAGRYSMGRLIGHGGMSDVYEGTDERLGRTVAIKLLKAQLAGDPTFRTRFRQEAQSAARMSHPTIVRVFDAGEETVRDDQGRERQQPFIVMEHVDGRMLKDIIDDGALDPGEAVRIAEGVLTALEYSHRAGVVHRDIKPSNVMITRTGQVKVMDFGIARAVSDSSATMAQTTAILGTAGYFSPEQAKGESVDARTDLYSTGIVLFEMLTGRAPFRGETAVAVAYQHVSETPVAPSSVNPRVSPALDAVVGHSLAKDRFDRYQSAVEFRGDLETAASGRIPSRTQRETYSDTLYGVPQGGITASEAALRQLSDDDSMKRVQSRPPAVWIWAGILSVAVIVIALLFWVFTQTPTTSLAQGTEVVPSVAGQSFEQAVTSLNSHDLKWSRLEETSATVETGHVIRSDPSSGTTLTRGSTVDLYVSTGKRDVSVPDVSNKTITDARNAIRDAGLVPGEVRSQNSATLAQNVVISTSPGAGTAKEGSTIDFTVSNGKVTLVDLTGMPIADASAILTDANTQLVPDPTPDPTCTTEAGLPVRQQDQAPGDVTQGSTVKLIYCSGN